MTLIGRLFVHPRAMGVGINLSGGLLVILRACGTAVRLTKRKKWFMTETDKDLTGHVTVILCYYKIIQTLSCLWSCTSSATLKDGYKHPDFFTMSIISKLNNLS